MMKSATATNSSTTLAAAFLVACAAAVLAPIASAQVVTATIRGSVVDQQRAVLPGVTITATQLETNTARTVMTTAVGQYYLPGLPAGTYEVTADLSGFAPERRKLELTVGADVTIEFSLKIGTIAMTETVTAEAPLLETTKTVVGVTIRKDQIDTLPTVNRDFTALALLAPGASEGVGGNGPTLAFNAQRGFQNGIFIDGASNVWKYYGKQASTFPQDWMQEFQVMTNSFSAEFGAASGGILNVITRSGSNEYHGRAYGFFQRKAWNALPFSGTFTNNEVSQPVFLASANVPDYTQRRWGGVLGGPVIKDRLFFFGGYEDLMRQSTSPLAISS